jgi:hypothetical protein
MCASPPDYMCYNHQRADWGFASTIPRSGTQIPVGGVLNNEVVQLGESKNEHTNETAASAASRVFPSFTPATNRIRDVSVRLKRIASATVKIFAEYSHAMMPLRAWHQYRTKFAFRGLLLWHSSVNRDRRFTIRNHMNLRCSRPKVVRLQD